jgi:hypothetical protein
MLGVLGELTPAAYVVCPPANPPSGKRRVWSLVVAALATSLTGLLGYWVFASAPSRDASPSAAKPSVPRLVSTTAPVEIVVSLDERSTACIAEYFPADSFEPDASLSFVCTETELEKSAARLYELAQAKYDRAKLDAEFSRVEQLKARLAAQKALIRGELVVVPPHPDSTSVTAKRSHRPLGWYELPATAMMRRKCCLGASPAKLPPSGGRCENLEDTVRDFADASERAGDLAPKAKHFERAVQCLLASEVRAPYSYRHPPDAASGAAFQRFLSDAAVIDVQRRAKRSR